ncbi:HET-domain-containing protein [Hyaloscypha variabilis F]|uniref:HET-domain-containing protein n=1 Tax=Hyaloscypha variabilis (strain UAMH 11265 / GT02V1 / F) TaxID=1149755 RepID=A0A2J6R5Z6_HYAVF|nr:HET-domain-containing protein [Hyaloscypha variabilis F]
MSCEDITASDEVDASMRRKKPRLTTDGAPEMLGSGRIPNPGPETISMDMEGVGSERQSSRMINLSVIHGPSDVSLSLVPAEEQFPYQPLDTTKFEIRVITLHPGIQTDQIHCSMTHIATNRGSKPRYTALSYTWGTPESPKSILLNGVQVQVRENLWQALYHLRSEERDLRIWIDALCINQNDLQERSSQVSRMSAIYGIAKEVVVWLGPAGDGSELAMDFMQRKFHPQQGSSERDIPLDEILLQSSEAELEATAKLMTREYWHRVWIVQEIFKARSITIHCGHDTMQWSSLSNFFRYLSMHDWTEPIGRRGTATSKYDYLLLACASPAISLTELRTSQKHCLEDLLKAYKDCHSSDPRDKVYALVGLAQRRMRSKSDPVSKGDNWIDVDYSKSTLDIFRTLVALYLDASKFYLDHEGLEVIQWMQLLQEVLDLRGSPDNDHTQALILAAPLREHSWRSNSEFTSDRGFVRLADNGITCACYIVSAASLFIDFASSPSWDPLAKEYCDLLELYSSIPGIDHSRRSKAYLESILRHFRDHNLEGLKKFENPTTNTDPSLSIQVSFGLKGRYLIMSPCPIREDCEFIGFANSEIALMVMGTLVVCRAVIYRIDRNWDRSDGTHLFIEYGAFPDIVVPPNGHLREAVPRPNGLPWERTTVTLSIEDWARVVSLGNWPARKGIE